MLPIARPSRNHTFPSGPGTRLLGAPSGLNPALNSVIAPLGVILPIAFVPASLNQRLPSGPATMSYRPLPGLSPELNSMIAPLGVILPIALVVPISVNHKLPSGPGTTIEGRLPAFKPTLNSVIVPVVEIRQIPPVCCSTNHRSPSGPNTKSSALLTGLRPALNCVMVPAGVIRPMAFFSLNQIFPSDPATASPRGQSMKHSPSARPTLNCVIVPSGAIRPIASALRSVNHRFPSGPDTIPQQRKAPGPLNSVIVPPGVTLPIAPLKSVNHMFPSGPDVMSSGSLPTFKPMLNSVMVPTGVATAVVVSRTKKRLLAVIKTTAASSEPHRDLPTIGRKIPHTRTRDSGSPPQLAQLSQRGARGRAQPPNDSRFENARLASTLTPCSRASATRACAPSPPRASPSPTVPRAGSGLPGPSPSP